MIDIIYQCKNCKHKATEFNFYDKGEMKCPKCKKVGYDNLTAGGEDE